MQETHRSTWKLCVKLEVCLHFCLIHTCVHVLTAAACFTGAHYWNRGYYTPHVRGLAPPGMLFVLSCKICSRFTWFALNQATLDRGPGYATCAPTNDNCWGSGSAGELDFLETGFWEPAFYNNSQPDGSPNTNRNNSRLYVTSYNGAGRCFPVNKGNANVDDRFIAAKAAGGACSSNYFVDDGQPHMYAAVVDRRGSTVYRDPVWKGLNQTHAATLLEASAPEPPEVLAPPCHVGAESCALNNPSCLFQEPFPQRLGAGRVNYSVEQLPCSVSEEPPANEWGFRPCNASSVAATHARGYDDASRIAEARRGVAEAVIADDSGLIGSASATSFASGEGTDMGLRRSLQAAQTYCCNHSASASNGNSSCYAFPHPGKLCFDPVCDKAKDAVTCQKTNNTAGIPCIPQFPAAPGYPECGSGSSSLIACEQQCGAKQPPGPPVPPTPPPPPAPPVYCCNCTESACVEARASGARFCTAGSGGSCNPHPPGKLCPDFSCAKGEHSQANCSKIKGCQWQGDANQSLGEVKCGAGSMALEACTARCSPPPKPACTPKNNWWDLFEDTGQHMVEEAGCDTEACVYPRPPGNDRCQPYPFFCCDSA